MFEKNLFSDKEILKPLADRMRPRTLQELFGQLHILAPGKYLPRMIERDSVTSMLFYGLPGTGKTTIARVIANMTGDYFQQVNAVSAGVADLRTVIQFAEGKIRRESKRTILFIDEIHRFNKLQQDTLLPYVENGMVILIGATTENPYFSINSALLSRLKVIKLEKLTVHDIKKIISSALADQERGLAGKISLLDSAIEQIAHIANGDARTALNILEQLFFLAEEHQQTEIDNEMLRELMPEIIRGYDKNGDQHYDIVSAFIKSIRGSDADASLHYLARMIDGGEDLMFIARRIVISAAEDIGDADPQALILATAAMQAAHMIGLPEARIILSEAVCYLATAPKSNRCYLAIDEALADVRNGIVGEVPLHLRDAHYNGAASFGHGKGYLYPHDYPNSQVLQQYLPDVMLGKKYYHKK